MSGCVLCPRHCMVMRDNGEKGFCRETDHLRVARAALWRHGRLSIGGKNPASPEKKDRGQYFLQVVISDVCTVRIMICQEA